MRFDAVARELHLKITYAGPSLSGRTTNMRYVYNKTRPEARSPLFSVGTETERHLHFDFTPLSLPPIDGHRLRLHLWCSPGARYIPGAAERVLEGADGVVFVASSYPQLVDRNVNSLRSLAACLEHQGRSLATTPLVLQYNMRDLPGMMAVAELDALLNPTGRPAFEAVAAAGIGVFDTLKASVYETLTHLAAEGTITPLTPEVTAKLRRSLH